MLLVMPSPATPLSERASKVTVGKEPSARGASPAKFSAMNWLAMVFSKVTSVVKFEPLAMPSRST
nr:hypothetical protein [Sphingomonas sp. Leaf10]